MDYLAHHGIMGQRWGVRRFQNKDGTWTKAGLDHRKNFNDRLEDYTNRAIEEKKYIKEKRAEYFDEDYYKSKGIREARESLLYRPSVAGLAAAIQKAPLSTRELKKRNESYKNDVNDFIEKVNKKYSINDETFREDAKIYSKMVNDIFNSMDKTDKQYIGGRRGDQKEELLSEYSAKKILENGAAFIEMHNDTPASFVYLQDGENVVVGSKSGDKYRGKGYASKNIQKAKDWADQNERMLYYMVYAQNKPSQNLAEKNGFTADYFNKYSTGDFEDKIYYYGKGSEQFKDNYDEDLDKELHKYYE